MLGFSALSETPLSALPDAGGATNATAEPGAGSLTLTGFAPTVTADQNVTAQPGAGALVLTGFAPTVSATQSQTVTPGTGALVITGYAPSVTVPTSVTVTPGVGALVITGYAPSVSTALARRGGKSDETGRARRSKWTKRKTYIEWSKQYWDERKKREDAVTDALFGTGPSRDDVDLPVAEAPDVEPPALVTPEAAVSLETERDCLTEIMQAAQAAFADRAARVHKATLRAVANQAKVELPAAGEKAEQQAFLDWLDARRVWIERQRAEAEQAEAERLEMVRREEMEEEQDEESVLMMLLAA